MSAQQQMRKMLDELMGTRRNGEKKSEKLDFRSTRVCKSFLLKCCPHEILHDTRCELGECKKVHDVALRADYENSSRKDEYAYQKEALIQLRNFVAQREKRTQISKIKLAEAQEHLFAEEALRTQRMQLLENKINEQLTKAEQLGGEGDVEGSLKLMEEIEALKTEKKKAIEDYKTNTPSSIHQQQKLRVCEVCTSYLGVHDNDKRLADHFNGRLHLGFMEIGDKLKELEELVENHHIRKIVEYVFEGGSLPKPKSPTPERPKRSRSRSRSHERRHKSSHSRRHKKHRHRHRERSHSSDKSHSSENGKTSGK